jgi:hypothetical protein
VYVGDTRVADLASLNESVDVRPDGYDDSQTPIPVRDGEASIPDARIDSRSSHNVSSLKHGNETKAVGSTRERLHSEDWVFVEKEELESSPDGGVASSIPSIVEQKSKGWFW